MEDLIPTIASEVTAEMRKRSKAILVALFFPTMAIILNGSMFGVALPTIRDEFMITADVAAWLTIAFSLPFMMLMPLYGRLGDELGRARMLITGVVIFAIGSVLALVAQDLPLVFIGRLIQGAGSAGVTPLSLAIISQRFLPEERGRALGTWNSIAPGTGVVAPIAGGYLVDVLGWRSIFVPVLAIGVLAAVVTWWKIPSRRDAPNWGVLRSFDWSGVLLLSGMITFLVFFVSSRPVTGVEPLRDWRLLLGVFVFGVSWVRREKRVEGPLVDLHILTIPSFRVAALSGGLRMGMMIGIGFLLPLYLTDVYALSASTIGWMATVHSAALFVTVRFGGGLADRFPNRWLVTLGLAMQLSAMLLFARLPAGQPLLIIILGVALQGLGGGLSLPALHRTALGAIPQEHTGAAAGLYSMTRFAGSMLATALAGVILQAGLDRGLPTLTAYQWVYGFLAIFGIIGVFLAYHLGDDPVPEVGE